MIKFREEDAKNRAKVASTLQSLLAHAKNPTGTPLVDPNKIGEMVESLRFWFGSPYCAEVRTALTIKDRAMIPGGFRASVHRRSPEGFAELKVAVDIDTVPELNLHHVYTKANPLLESDIPTESQR